LPPELEEEVRVPKDRGLVPQLQSTLDCSIESMAMVFSKASGALPFTVIEVLRTTEIMWVKVTHSIN
jgi:hypothetical protein